MQTVVLKKESKTEIAVVKKMRNYSKEPVFKKKAEKAIAFLKKHSLPKSFAKKKE